MSLAARSWIAAGITVLLLAAAVVTPIYRPRVAPAWRQARLLPQRITAGEHDLHASLKGDPYLLTMRVHQATPSDAVILVPDTVEDDPLHRVGWLSWFLYPRVLLHPSAVAAADVMVDYVLYTDHFHGPLPSTEVPPGLGLAPVSDRARRAHDPAADPGSPP